MYVLIHDICFSLSDLLHSVWQFLGLSLSLQMAQFYSFLWLSNIPLHVCATSSLSIPLLMDNGFKRTVSWSLFTHQEMWGSSGKLKRPLKHYQDITCFSYSHSSVQSLSRVWLFATPWTAAHQASPSITNSRVYHKTHYSLHCFLGSLPLSGTNFHLPEWDWDMSREASRPASTLQVMVNP